MNNKRFKKIFIILLCIILTLAFTACDYNGSNKNGNDILKPPGWDATPSPQDPNYELLKDPYRIYYQIFVYSFRDSTGNGVGDLRGIIQMLDYLNDGNPQTNDDLGIGGIWLTPIHPSPTYHKYDVRDYYDIDPIFGTMDDFEELIYESHKRGIKVIIDLVVNHTSARHPWFLAALNALKNGDFNNKYIDYYNFRQSGGNGYSNKDCPPGWWYECIFWDQMPDLNMDNPLVRAEFEDVIKFWIDKGVDGFRIDAMQHIYGPMNSPNVQKNIDFWSWFSEYCYTLNPDFFLVGEVFSGNENLLERYYETGFTSIFNFSFGNDYGVFNRTINNYGFDSSYRGNDLPYRLKNYQDNIRSKNPDAIDTIFLTNHDTNRSATNFGSDMGKMKLAASLYLTLPGIPFIYYGEELGQTGSGRDENKRSPMIWSKTDNTGLCFAVPNNSSPPVANGVAEQLANPNSLLRHYINVLNIRNKYPELAKGTMTPYNVNNAVSAYKMTYQGNSLIVLHNFSNSAVTLNFPKSTYQYEEIAYSLVGTSSINGNNLIIPAQSSVILR